MIRRFGWPNSGSDADKNLCSWSLTTPVDGLYLLVTPYLGGSNLHFAVRYNKAVQAALRRDPGRESFFRRKERVIRSWWKNEGCKLYVFGCGVKEGDEDELVHVYGEKDGKVWGLWQRKPTHKFGHRIPNGSMVLWWLGEFIKSKHPNVRLPKMTSRERQQRETPFHRKARKAIEATLSDLLRPVSVRDLSFTPFGDIESTPEAVERFKRQMPADRFIGAGHAPSYWFTKATRKERAGTA